MTKEGGSKLIAGFWFVNDAEAEQARKEAEGVAYIRAQTNMNDPAALLAIYNNMAQQKLFETAVGYAYMKELQGLLVKSPAVNNAEIRPIRVQHPIVEAAVAKKVKDDAADQRRKQRNKYRQRFHFALVGCFALAACVVAMFVISATSGSTTIINYENAIIDKYEEWDQELTEREAAVKAAEKELGITQGETD